MAHNGFCLLCVSDNEKVVAVLMFWENSETMEASVMAIQPYYFSSFFVRGRAHSGVFGV